MIRTSSFGTGIAGSWIGAAWCGLHNLPSGRLGAPWVSLRVMLHRGETECRSEPCRRQASSPKGRWSGEPGRAKLGLSSPHQQRSKGIVLYDSSSQIEASGLSVVIGIAIGVLAAILSGHVASGSSPESSLASRPASLAARNVPSAKPESRASANGELRAMSYD